MAAEGSKTYEYDVAMSCGGCSGAVEKVLTKWKTTHPDLDFNVTLETQKVRVTAPPTLSQEEIYEKINKVKPVSKVVEINA
ncbi:hypothetical protein ABW20_dc0106462 [Dactylellina cionopaga]|nr:hypothetical protein ABW20_dc0106462 [Dactylellina cionopaga]